MTTTNTKKLDELDEEMRLLQAKLAAIEQKKLTLLEAEGAIRTEMQRVENQRHRLKGLGGVDHENHNGGDSGSVFNGLRGA